MKYSRNRQEFTQELISLILANPGIIMKDMVEVTGKSVTSINRAIRMIRLNELERLEKILISERKLMPTRWSYRFVEPNDEAAMTWLNSQMQYISTASLTFNRESLDE